MLWKEKSSEERMSRRAGRTWKCSGQIFQIVHRDYSDCSCARLQPCVFCLKSSHLCALSVVKPTTEAVVLLGFDSSFPGVSSQHSHFFISLSFLRGSSFTLLSFSSSSFPAQPVGNHCLSNGCDLCRLGPPGPRGPEGSFVPMLLGTLSCHSHRQLLLQAL